MEIAINGRFLAQRITGVQRFAIEIVKALDNLLENQNYLPNVSFFILVPKYVDVDLKLKHIKILKKGRLNTYLWEQIELPFWKKNAFLLNFCNLAPICIKQQLVVIHDAAVFARPQAYSFFFRIVYRFAIPFLCRRIELLVTVSQFSKNELSYFCKIKEKKIHVIDEGHEHISLISGNDDVFNKYDIKKSTYIIMVGSLNPNKNLLGFIKAINYLKDTNLKIIIIGRNNSLIFTNIAIPIYDKITRIDEYLSDEEMKSLLGSAICLVFPSYYEGFGLPPLEAMACGCPVIVSDRASLTEVCGNAALYCEPDKPKDIALKIRRLLNNRQQYEEYQKRGYKQADKYHWSNAALQLLTIILSKKRNLYP